MLRGGVVRGCMYSHGRPAATPPVQPMADRPNRHIPLVPPPPQPPTVHERCTDRIYITCTHTHTTSYSYFSSPHRLNLKTWRHRDNNAMQYQQSPAAHPVRRIMTCYIDGTLSDIPIIKSLLNTIYYNTQSYNLAS